jgi:hypothetical protein
MRGRAAPPMDTNPGPEMTTMQCKWSLAGLLTTVCCCWAVLPAAAVEGPRFGSEIMAADQLNTAQTAEVQDSVKKTITQMIAAERPEDVVALRDSMLDPLSQGAKVAFSQAYRTALEKNLLLALGRGVRPQVRVNVMILVQMLISKYETPASLQPLIDAGLSDSQPGGWATVYCAAKAAQTLIGTGSKLTAAQEQALVKSLGAAVVACEKCPGAARPSAWIALGQLNRALALTSDPTPLLDGLKRRLNDCYIKDPSLSPDAEREGLTELYQRLMSQNAPPARTVKDVAAITFQYLDMAGKFADTSPDNPTITAPESAVPGLVRYMQAADNILPWALSLLDPKGTVPAPQPMKNFLSPLNILKVRLIISEGWEKALSQAPISIPGNVLHAAVPLKK